jgi:hypothetical protein
MKCHLVVVAKVPRGIVKAVMMIRIISIHSVQGLLLPQPTYNGPQKVMYFRDGKTFKEEVAKDKKGYWMVEFYTAWNPSCVNFAPIFAELSHK